MLSQKTNTRSMDDRKEQPDSAGDSLISHDEPKPESVLGGFLPSGSSMTKLIALCVAVLLFMFVYLGSPLSSRRRMPGLPPLNTPTRPNGLPSPADQGLPAGWHAQTVYVYRTEKNTKPLFVEDKPINKPLPFGWKYQSKFAGGKVKVCYCNSFTKTVSDDFPQRHLYKEVVTQKCKSWEGNKAMLLHKVSDIMERRYNEACSGRETWDKSTVEEVLGTKILCTWREQLVQEFMKYLQDSSNHRICTDQGVDEQAEVTRIVNNIILSGAHENSNANRPGLMGEVWESYVNPGDNGSYYTSSFMSTHDYPTAYEMLLSNRLKTVGDRVALMTTLGWQHRWEGGNYIWYHPSTGLTADEPQRQQWFDSEDARYTASGLPTEFPSYQDIVKAKFLETDGWQVRKGEERVSYVHTQFQTEQFHFPTPVDKLLASIGWTKELGGKYENVSRGLEAKNLKELQTKELNARKSEKGALNTQQVNKVIEAIEMYKTKELNAFTVLKSTPYFEKVIKVPHNGGIANVKGECVSLKQQISKIRIVGKSIPVYGTLTDEALCVCGLSGLMEFQKTMQLQVLRIQKGEFAGHTDAAFMEWADKQAWFFGDYAGLFGSLSFKRES